MIRPPRDHYEIKAVRSFQEHATLAPGPGTTGLQPRVTTAAVGISCRPRNRTYQRTDLSLRNPRGLTLVWLAEVKRMEKRGVLGFRFSICIFVSSFHGLWDYILWSYPFVTGSNLPSKVVFGHKQN